MLERTAASIEPGRFQRVLPSSSSTYSLRNRRQLHTTFWQHAAPDLELLDACSAVMRMPLPASAGTVAATNPESRLEPSLASTFLLDLLNPNGVAPFLRRLRTTLKPLLPFSGDQKTRKLATWVYSSPSGRKPDNSPPTQDCSEVSEVSEQASEIRSSQDSPDLDMNVLDGFRSTLNGADGGTQLRNLSRRSDHELGRELAEGVDVSDAGISGATVLEWSERPDQSEEKSLSGLEALEALRDILKSQDDTRAYERVWSLYNGLEDTEKETLRAEVLLYLSQSTRPVEAWRVCELFSLYDVEEWTNDLVEAAVRARLMFQDVSTAQAVFTTALERRRLGKALDPFVVYCFRTSNWSLFFDAWALFEANMLRRFDQPGSIGRPAKLVHPLEFRALPTLPEFETKLKELDNFARATDLERAPQKKDQEAAQLTDQEIAQQMDQEVSQLTDQAVAQLTEGGVDQLAYQAVPQLPDREVAQLTDRDVAQPTHQTQESVELRERLRSFLKLLARWSLSAFSPTAAVAILNCSRDPAAHVAFIYICIRNGWARLAIDTYRKLRRLPGVSIRGHFMHTISEVFYRQKDALAMQQLLEDWTSSGQPMSLKAYQRFIAFYARQGDEPTVKRLVKGYTKEHRFAKLDESVLSALIQVHTVNGDCEGALRVFEDHAAISANPPRTTHWNLLLQAYVKNRDLEGAMSVFMRLCEENQPDQYSFGIIMGITGTRGDLKLTLDLLKLSAEFGVKPNTAIMDTLVEAYCQNDRFEEAALLCARTAKDPSVEGDRICLWNTLLHHHARRRDLTSVNRVLDYMTKNGVPYDTNTYTCLLRALVYCKQVHHALHLIRVAIKDGIFQPTEEHYVLLMSGFIRTGEIHMALKTSEAVRYKFPQTARRMTAVIRALAGRKTDQTRHDADLGDRVQLMNRALWEFRKSVGEENAGFKATHRAAAEQYSQVIFLLIQLRDIASVREILSLYSLQFPARASQETIPMKLLLDLMLAEYSEKNYDRVKEIFAIILSRLEREGKRLLVSTSSADENGQPEKPVAEGILPSLRYELCDALKTMQRMYQDTNDAAGLMDMVKDVQRRGFRLDSKNWNYYVQALARLNLWQEAFAVCERELMPAWKGWKHRDKANLPAELRELGKNPRLPRPISYTLLVLTRVWTDLDQLTLWSPEASRMKRKIEDSCPRVVRAVTSQQGRYNRRDYKANKFGLKPRTPDDKEERKMRWIRRLAKTEVEQDEYEDVAQEAFAQDELEGAPGVSYTKKPIDDVKTPYPWRTTWTKSLGLQMEDSERTMAPEDIEVLKEQAYRREELARQKFRALYGEDPIQKQSPTRHGLDPWSEDHHGSDDRGVDNDAFAQLEALSPRRLRSQPPRKRRSRSFSSSDDQWESDRDGSGDDVFSELEKQLVESSHKGDKPGHRSSVPRPPNYEW